MGKLKGTCAELGPDIIKKLKDELDNLKRAIDDVLGTGKPQPALAGGGSMDANDVKRMTGADPQGAAKGGGSTGDAAKNGGTSGKTPDNAPKDPGTKPSTGSEPKLPVHENFDSAADAIGDLNGTAELIEKSKTSKQFWIDQGYTEAHRVRDSSGTIHTVFYNPKTKKYSGGHTSHNQDD